jgi:hypothetical protein
VAVGEATPLDLFYSRATIYGDVWEVMDYVTADDDLLLDRWPWLENKHDILSGEAGMLANPGGTFMYSVWNQWEETLLPDGHELVFNSDILFRRVMYLPDDSTVERIPYIETLYAPEDTLFSQEADDVITLIVTGKDFDRVGEDQELVEYEWLVDGAPWAGPEGDFETDCYQTQQCNMPARNLSNGWHGFSVRGKDNDGQWSKTLTFDVLVWRAVTQVFIPMTTK